jgi:hypothetical protein
LADLKLRVRSNHRCWRGSPITASRTSGFEPYRHRLQAASYDSLYRPEAVVETDLAGRLDFRQLFARLDEPDE